MPEKCRDAINNSDSFKDAVSYGIKTRVFIGSHGHWVLWDISVSIIILRLKIRPAITSDSRKLFQPIQKDSKFMYLVQLSIKKLIKSIQFDK